MKMHQLKKILKLKKRIGNLEKDLQIAQNAAKYYNEELSKEKNRQIDMERDSVKLR